MSRRLSQRSIGAIFSGIIALLLVVNIQGSLTAQSGFATNTPSGGSVDPTSTPGSALATNTPVVTPVPTEAGIQAFATVTPTALPPTPVPSGPDELLFNYALRIWLENDLIDLAFEQVAALEADNLDKQRAVNLTLYELNYRFPDAPRDLSQRRRLVQAMLAAPSGTIDMRGVVRPLIENAINNQPETLNFETDGFRIEQTPVTLDSSGDADDRIVRITYQDGETVLYDEYVMALAQGAGYRILPTTYDLFAVPFGGVENVQLIYSSDVNRDRIDEMVLQVDDGAVSDRLYIVQQRNGRAVDLTAFDFEIRVATILDWPVDNPDVRDPVLNVVQRRAVTSAPYWPCNEQIEYDWTYERNLYRRSAELNARYERVPGLGCTLLDAEPLFSQPPENAIPLVENALLLYGFDAPGSERALMTLAALYALNGRFEDARNTAQSVLPAGETDSWIAQQASALLTALDDNTNTALDLCAALATASEFPACDMNAVVGRYLSLIDLTTDQDLAAQLDAVNLPVAEVIERREIGRADRLVVSFNLPDTGWWGFVAERDGTYRAEVATAPAGFEAAVFPQGQIQPPQAAFDALYIEDNPSRVLTILENLEIENPGVPFAPAGLYLRALAFDLSNSRQEARELYYEVWERYPATVYAQLAANHLELR